jgi:hypothetical protein
MHKRQVSRVLAVSEPCRGRELQQLLIGTGDIFGENLHALLLGKGLPKLQVFTCVATASGEYAYRIDINR